ncbi:MAG: VCBS repeat-containing protein [Fidelibacterota bacterium]|nr:MAG: VCBS repeat-containing protein [Candidatus Neomarinimicrobiota bacterium]
MTSFVSAEVTINRIVTQGQSVTVLGGGWDFNMNGQLEILALLEPADSLAASEIGYYELSQADTLLTLWRYRLEIETLALFSDASVTNLNGDQRPEITALLYYQTLEDRSTPRWLWVFDWDDAANMFSAEPTTQWNYRGQGISYLRPRQLVAADLNTDGDDELVITTGSPDRMVLIADWSPNGMRVHKVFRSRAMALGPWPFSVALADFDGDTRQDILVIGHGRPRTLPVYLNRRDDFHAISISIPEVEMVLPEAIATSDLNNDGQEEVILPHTNGSFTLINLTGRTLSAAVLDTRIPNLVDLKTVDLDGDGTTEMIYLQADGTITTNDTRFVTPITREQILSNLPADLTPPLDYHSLAVIPATEQRPSILLLAVHTLTGAFISSSEMGEPRPLELALPTWDLARPEAVSDIEIITGEPEQVTELEPFVVHEEATEVYFPEQARAPDPRALPPHRTPDILLYPGDEFARNVLGERTEQFAGFRFISKAPRMVFNFQRQAVVWQPALEHLGSWLIEYEITYDVGVKPEAMVTDSIMVPEKEIVRDQLLLYVNDKPRITSEPESKRILAGHLFAYRIQVEDRNADARIDYRLESGPEGMVIEHNGILSWRTNETHHDDYPVVISVSDGFDKDVQTFALNVNAQLTITSAVPHIARVQKPYRYPLEVFQPGTQRAHMFSLLQAPNGMQIDSSGLITWTPTPAQLDTQHFQVQVSDGTAQDTQVGWIYVNAQPKLTQAPPRAVAVVAGDTLRLTFSGRDSNSGQSLEWKLAGGPLNMDIDSAGNLTWPTTSQNLDAAHYIVELFDGIDVTPFKGTAFVNAPIRISSLPPDSATVGMTYRYPIVTRDDNRSTLLKFRRPTVATDVNRTVAYQVTLLDDKFRRDLPRYLSQFKDMRNVFINKPPRPEAGEVAQAARIDLKQHVEHIFIDEDQLIIVAHSPQHSMIELEDILWEFFQGGRGIMPQYSAERIPFVHYNLREFPDGMTVDHDGLLTWTPTPVQAGFHQIRLTVSDGYTRDEQVFQVYANYPPAIISQADTLALVEQRYTYRVRVDDKNEDAHLSFRLTKHPEGMKVDSKGVVTWIPSVEQINWQEFEVEVFDGHARDRQATSLFVNMPPRIISQPKPVALNNFEYNYRVVAEDLNRDPIHYRATKLPRYADFDPRTGLFKWRPRDIQKGPNDITFEITDSHGGVTIHEFQIHVFEDPSRRRFLFTGWPLMLAFVGVIFVLGIAVGG